MHKGTSCKATSCCTTAGRRPHSWVRAGKLPGVPHDSGSVPLSWLPAKSSTCSWGSQFRPPPSCPRSGTVQVPVQDRCLGAEGRGKQGQRVVS